MIRTEFPKSYLNQTYHTFRKAFQNTNPIVQETCGVDIFSAPECLTKLIQNVGRFAEHYASDLLWDLKPIWYLMQGVLPEGTAMDEIYVFGIRKNGVHNGPQVMECLMKDIGPYQPYLYPEKEYRKIMALHVRIFQTNFGWQTYAELADITSHLNTVSEQDLDENGKLILLDKD